MNIINNKSMITNKNNNRCTILSDNIEVEIQDHNFVKVGDAVSLNKAARMCYINNSQKIWRYLFIKSPKRESKNRISGIKAMTGKRFHFKLKEI